MKKLLVLLMLGAGLNAYATSTPGPLSLHNSTSVDVAFECFPSGNWCNGVGDNSGCTCPDTDTVMFFGRTSVPQTQAQLEAITAYGATWVGGKFSNYHDMGDGHVWEIALNTTESVPQRCTLLGDPRHSVDCTYNSPK